ARTRADRIVGFARTAARGGWEPGPRRCGPNLLKSDAGLRLPAAAGALRRCSRAGRPLGPNALQHGRRFVLAPLAPGQLRLGRHQLAPERLGENGRANWGPDVLLARRISQILIAVLRVTA